MKSPVRINESVNLGRTHTNDFEDLEDDELNDSSICMSQTPFNDSVKVNEEVAKKAQ